MRGIDEALFRVVNGWSDSMRPFYWFLSEGSKQVLVRIGFAVLATWMIAAGPRSRRAGVQALIAFPLANGVTDVLKNGFHVLRPCVALSGVVEHGVKFLDSYGTASAHSANMAAVAFVITYHMKWWGLPWIVLALLTGVSRVYVGVHYPSQVLLGWFCGVFAAFVVTKTWEAFVRARRQRADGGRGAA